MTNNSASSWERLGRVSPTELTEGRLQLHWASQIVAAVGEALVKPEADDSHASMECLAATKIFAGGSVAPSPHPRAALSVPDLELRLMGGLTETVTAYPLVGRTLDEGLDWMASAIGVLTKEESPSLARPTQYEMPSHAIEKGAAFSDTERAAFGELALWFANAQLVLTEAAANQPFTTAVRCWPHHFDLGFLVLLEPEKDPQTARSIGLGMSPGDATYPQPYFYVNPYPRPDDPRRAELAGGGHWHAEGFFGAILLGERVTADDSAEAQRHRTRSFIDSALEVLIT